MIVLSSSVSPIIHLFWWPKGDGIQLKATPSVAKMNLACLVTVQRLQLLGITESLPISIIHRIIRHIMMYHSRMIGKNTVGMI